MNLNSNKEMLRQFREETLKRCDEMNRFSMVSVILGSPFFLFLDYLIAKEKMKAFIIVRGLMMLSMGVFYLLTKLKNGVKNAMWYSTLGVLTCSFFITILIHMTGKSESTYYAGLLILFFALCIWLPVSFRFGLAAAAGIYGMYAIPLLMNYHEINWTIFVNNNYFIFFIFFLSLTSLKYYNDIRLNEFKSRFNLQSANKELSKLDKLKSQFFSNISHEIRTPLTSITAPLEKFNSLIDPQSHRASVDERTLSQMTLNANKLLKLINDLLDFSRLESGMMTLSCRRVDLVAMIYELVESVMPNADKKSQTIEVKVNSWTAGTAGSPIKTLVDDSVGGVLGDDGVSGAFGDESVSASGGDKLELYLDPGKIDKVFMNLLINAIKFTPENGKITVTINEHENNVKVLVADNGIGIPDEELPRMFERFHQVDGSSTRSYGGTGIGLNMAKELVLLHSGNITVESKLDAGSVFTVELLKGTQHLTQKQIQEDFEEDRRKTDRRSDERRQLDVRKIQVADLQADQEMKLRLQEEIAKEVVIPDDNREVVQIIDDDPSIVGLIRNTLLDSYRLRVAFDGQEGWEQIKQNPPDLIISDLMMPKMGGFEVMEEVRKNPKTRYLPVIILTAKGEINSKIQGLQKGADDYLAKPFNEGELRARVKSLLNMRKLENELAVSYEKLKEAEATLIHTDKIRALGVMLMGLAHELNNPLAFIQGGSTALQKIMKKHNLSEIKDVNTVVDSILEGVKRCYNVMDELRRFVRKDVEYYEPLEINESIETSLKLLKHLTTDKIEIVKEYSTDKKIECVPGQLGQVTLNILHNAVLAIKDKGVITIRTKDDGKNAYIEVADTGEGIAKENLPKVFDPFFTTRAPNQGMGLGLSVCYKIISDHGGDISFESEIGVGTKVKVRLPMVQKSKEGILHGSEEIS